MEDYKGKIEMTINPGGINPSFQNMFNFNKRNLISHAFLPAINMTTADQ